MLTSINDLFDKFLHSLTGVWIGTHIEIVRTSQYEIVFERNPSIDPLYRSALYAIRFENNQLRKTLIGLCEYYAATARKLRNTANKPICCRTICLPLNR